MKIINCGIVTYLILDNHIATIVYYYNDGHPAAHIYYDGEIGEIVEAANGQTMRFAIRLAKWMLKDNQYTKGL